MCLPARRLPNPRGYVAAKRRMSKAMQTAWLTLALLVVVLAAFLLPTGCEFEPSSIHLPKHPPKRVVLERDDDGGE